jgi:hypothetical protein
MSVGPGHPEIGTTTGMECSQYENEDSWPLVLGILLLLGVTPEYWIAYIHVTTRYAATPHICIQEPTPRI